MYMNIIIVTTNNNKTHYVFHYTSLFTFLVISYMYNWVTYLDTGQLSNE